MGREPNGVVSAQMVVERTITLRKNGDYIAVMQNSAHIDNCSYAVAILLVVAVAVVEGICTESVSRLSITLENGPDACPRGSVEVVIFGILINALLQLNIRPQGPLEVVHEHCKHTVGF